MSTQTLSFHLPVNPQPSKSNYSAQIVATDGWKLTVKKTGSNRSRDTSTKSIIVSVSSAHYDSFCDAFHNGSGTKNVLITFTGSVVNSIDWGSGAIPLPDNTALMAAIKRDRAFELELGTEILSELRQLNETMTELLCLTREQRASGERVSRGTDIRDLSGTNGNGDLELTTG